MSTSRGSVSLATLPVGQGVDLADVSPGRHEEIGSQVTLAPLDLRILRAERPARRIGLPSIRNGGRKRASTSRRSTRSSTAAAIR